MEPFFDTARGCEVLVFRPHTQSSYCQTAPSNFHHGKYKYLKRLAETFLADFSRMSAQIQPGSGTALVLWRKESLGFRTR